MSDLLTLIDIIESVMGLIPTTEAGHAYCRFCSGQGYYDCVTCKDDCPSMRLEQLKEKLKGDVNETD